MRKEKEEYRRKKRNEMNIKKERKTIVIKAELNKTKQIQKKSRREMKRE